MFDFKINIFLKKKVWCGGVEFCRRKKTARFKFYWETDFGMKIKKNWRSKQVRSCLWSLMALRNLENHELNEFFSQNQMHLHAAVCFIVRLGYFASSTQTGRLPYCRFLNAISVLLFMSECMNFYVMKGLSKVCNLGK